jgi:hypothetical protein
MHRRKKLSHKARLLLLAGSCLLPQLFPFAAEAQTALEVTVLSTTEAQERFQEGVDFFAAGPEGTWTVEIDFEKGMRITSADGFSLSTPPVSPQVTANGEEEVYRAEVESGVLIISIATETCPVNGAGYRVKVASRYSSEKEFRSFSGCGRYLYDQRLDDLWVMTAAPGSTLDPSALPKGLPLFEFQPAAGKLVGHTGCNNLRAELSVRGNSLSVEGIVTTKMACPDSRIEREILGSMQDKSFVYTISDGRLFLEGPSGVRIAFRKTD